MDLARHAREYLDDGRGLHRFHEQPDCGERQHPKSVALSLYASTRNARAYQYTDGPIARVHVRLRASVLVLMLRRWRTSASGSG